ncbi:predicted protein [Phaeodactylum tricornutum CCAP 1055/1]|uniref:Uncharacterized protein n=1 Tax=Phaeodactylum tricornutum (strain CCAP 1055/1) TaxID=556484 RepID=B7G5H8_PHATC|nr:predicted protein [Phaeodactylum tricornutum CCAP 1055/1]EEC46152.1 predicted protein [Phaeodactylum tricornutum CCAP 1055/1]|eukprot:XP_002182251.1 predicted protein [Phaeodactylum tricornutum CCAP 1055/1]
MAPKPLKKKNGRPPPIDKLMKPAIGIGLALLAYQFFKGIGAEIPRVNTEDELELREVLFGEAATGKSYAVLCHPEVSTIPISSVFQDASNDGGAPAEFRVLDCGYVLPSSEMSIADRFKLDLKSRPTIFVSGAVGGPKQVPTKNLKTGAMLVKFLRAKLGLTAAKIETTQDLRSKCLDKDMCGLLLKGAKKAPNYLKDAMNNLLKEYPTVSFASIDSSVLYAKNLEEYLPELESSQPRFVVFKKVSGSTEAGGDRLISSIAAIPTNGVSYGQMSNLVANVVNKSQELTKLTSLPVIKTRTKKLEQEERAKRDRKNNRQQEKDHPVSGSSSFEANDGSREGRKLERERRRAEHRETNNVREKTPEEIAEIERLRRQRMEEEAAKWNMAPDDLPEGGDPFMGEDMEYEDSTTSDDDDEEDVIDLD